MAVMIRNNASKSIKVLSVTINRNVNAEIVLKRNYKIAL
uniref:MSP domain-containing protein n=1 Tax=Ascaris lumbricoides TaxID=6252 RepID=A0A0M3IGI5_ASCLU